ncbi:hypothetical protein SAMN05421759_12016 [Roseivivax lentus]|uniref:Uncharacterized protein n=2 Tax=Roseivivax lentus TaxID=633194 RepID=A0A1N7PTY5_9RHOB|nr:hypothetical protein SAMN05421759_12016 [Roseivivax lentus]
MDCKPLERLSFPESTVRNVQLIEPALSEALTDLLCLAQDPSTAPIALSFVFQDAPFCLSYPAIDGTVEASEQGFRLLHNWSGPEGLHRDWETFDTLPGHSDEFLPVLVNLGFLLSAFRNWGLEVLTGQAYLTPVSLSVLPIHGRLIEGWEDHGRICMGEAYHSVQIPHVASHRAFLQARGKDLCRFLNSLSAPASQLKNDHETALRIMNEEEGRREATLRARGGAARVG